MSERSSPQKSGAADGAVTAQQQRVLDTASLFGGGREVILTHRGEQYRLRLTQSGKLILTK